MNETPNTRSMNGSAKDAFTMTVDSIHEPWFSSFKREVVEMFSAKPAASPLPSYRPPLPGEEDLGPKVLDTAHEAWFQSLRHTWKTLRELKKLPPLRLTARPIRVKNIWGAYDYKKPGIGSSSAAHVVVVALMFTVFAPSDIQQAARGSVSLIIPVDVSPYLADIKMLAPGDTGGGGGGGQNSPLPASKGKLPRFSMRQFAPPTPVIKNENPKLAVEPTLLGPPEMQVPNIAMNVFGDPFGKIGPPSAGPGTGGGIGSGRGTGVGSGTGGGLGPGSGGGTGGGVFRVGGGVSAPRLIKKVEPEYSEEARKAKYQGTVVLAVQVWEDGRAHNVRIVRSLGLGLDEKAIEAVRQWRFVPGRKENKPVKVAATIEVNFRLL